MSTCMDDLLVLESCKPEGPAMSLPVNMQAITTPLHWQAWNQCLASHPDQRFQHYIVDGIQSGFRLGFDYY